MGQTVINPFDTTRAHPKPFTLSWTHYLVLLGDKNSDERCFYEIEATVQNWTVRELKRESERAGLLQKAILDIVIDTINQRTGGGPKYINQRDEDFIQSAFIEENYRKQFTDALKDCVDMGNFNYAVYTDKIYVSILREKSKEYRQVLRLDKRANFLATFLC